MTERKNITRTTTTKTQVEVDATKIRQMAGAPSGAIVYVMVPSGGDYSGMKLELGSDAAGVFVEWEETATETV